MIPLTVGTLLALVALAFVLYPLLTASAPQATQGSREREARATARDVASAQGSAIDALREVEFDRATGKLSDADYEALKATYTRQALADLRAEELAAAESTVVPSDIDPAEAVVMRYREAVTRVVACAVHGPRPEPDALYCSECGRYLAGKCAHCGAPVSQPGARFCIECGQSLAA